MDYRVDFKFDRRLGILHTNIPSPRRLMVARLYDKTYYAILKYPSNKDEQRHTQANYTSVPEG